MRGNVVPKKWIAPRTLLAEILQFRRSDARISGFQAGFMIKCQASRKCLAFSFLITLSSTTFRFASPGEVYVNSATLSEGTTYTSGTTVRSLILSRKQTNTMKWFGYPALRLSTGQEPPRVRGIGRPRPPTQFCGLEEPIG